MPVADIDASYMFYSLHEFLSSLSKVGKFSKRFDEDFISQLNNKYSVLIIILITLMISTKQYVGDPIICMPPAEFTFSMVEYTNHLCWVSNTYYLPMSQRPLLANEKRDHVITYYQWIPLILILQGAMFFAPSLIWRFNSSHSGLSVNKINMLLSGLENLNPDVRDKAIGYMVKHLDRAIQYQQEYRVGVLSRFAQRLAEHCSLCCGKVYGNYLTMLSLLVKGLYLVGSVGQLLILVEFIGDGYLLYGVEAFRSIIEKKYHNSKLFPRVTLCDVQVRQFSNVQMFTVQCALPINLFNEKVYLFLWLWLCLLSFLNLLSTVSFIWQNFLPNRKSFVKRCLRVYSNVNNIALTEEDLHKFVCRYLRPDGNLILRMIESDANDILVAEVTGKLYDKYLRRELKKKILDEEMGFVVPHNKILKRSVINA